MSLHNHKHDHCQHVVKYCEKCNVCYCEKCGKEWYEKYIWNYWYSPYYTTTGISPSDWDGYITTTTRSTSSCTHETTK